LSTFVTVKLMKQKETQLSIYLCI